jgi:hypothetical protein
MFTASQLRALLAHKHTANSAANVARLARLSGEQIELEDWVRKQAASYPDAEGRARTLGAVAKSLAEAGRVLGAIQLAREAILTARHAGKEVMLIVFQDVTSVLVAGGMRDELAAMAEAVQELR